MFYLKTHSTHFIYSHMASDIWLRTILIVRKETHCRHIGYSFRLTARVLLYAPSHRQDSTYHSLCYTSRGAPCHFEGCKLRIVFSQALTLTRVHAADVRQETFKSNDMSRLGSDLGLGSVLGLGSGLENYTYLQSFPNYSPFSVYNSSYFVFWICNPSSSQL